MLPAVRIEPPPGDAPPERRHDVAELYRRYGPAVYRRSLRLLGEREAARDATQEVFLKLVRDESLLQDRATLLPWMYRVTTNYCLNLRRNTRRRGEQDMPELEPRSDHAADTYPNRLLARSILSRFDVATQTVVVGVIVDGLGHDEMAVALGVSRKTIARKLDRFLAAAREFAAAGEAR